MKRHLLRLLFLLALLAALPVTAHAADDTLMLSGLDLDQLGSGRYELDEGYAVYTRANHTLLLVDAGVSTLWDPEYGTDSDWLQYALYTNHSLNLVLSGDCTLQGCIYTGGDLRISGRGSLNIRTLGLPEGWIDLGSSLHRAIYTAGDLTLSAAAVDILGAPQKYTGFVGVRADTFTMEDASLRARQSEGGSGYYTPQLSAPVISLTDSTVDLEYLYCADSLTAAGSTLLLSDTLSGNGDMTLTECTVEAGYLSLGSDNPNPEPQSLALASAEETEPPSRNLHFEDCALTIDDICFELNQGEASTLSFTGCTLACTYGIYFGSRYENNTASASGSHLSFDRSMVTAGYISTGNYLLAPPKITVRNCLFESPADGTITPVQEGSWNYYNILGDDDGPVVLTPASVLGEGVFHTGTVFWSLSADGVLTISGSGSMPDFAAGEEKPWDPFADAIRSIVVEQGVTAIGDRAFTHLTRVTSARLPEGLRELGVNAFYGCTKLKSVTLPKSLELMDAGVFQFCTSLTKLTIPAATFINYVETAFTGCTALSSVQVAAGNANFTSYNGAVYNADCTLLQCCPPGKSGTYTLHPGTLAVAGGALAGCDKLTQVNFPAGLTRLAVAAWYDGSAPARLTALRFAGPAPVVPDADTAVSLDRTVVIHYYEDQPGWDAARQQTWAEPFTFSAMSSVMDVKPYVTRACKDLSHGTVGGMQYFTNNTSKNTAKKKTSSLDQTLFVNSITAMSLQNADADSAAFIREQLGELLYVSTYRPIIFGGSEEALQAWPIQNTDNYGTVVDNDEGLASLGVSKVSWSSGAAGCFAYARFASAYVYGTAGAATATLKKPTVDEVIDLFHTYADPGEGIRYRSSASTAHSIVFLGESMDGLGFYFLSYGGGQYDDYAAYDTMDVGFITYERFANLCRYSLYLEDTNGGSYYAQTAKTVAENPTTLRGKVGKTVSYAVLTVACPVRLAVYSTEDGAELFNSRFMDDGETDSNDYGSLAVESDGENGHILTLTLYEPEPSAYEIVVRGTAEGAADLTMRLFQEEEDGSLTVDTRTFRDVPLVKGTDILVSLPTPQSDMQLLTTDEETTALWSVGPDGTAAEPLEDVDLACTHGDLSAITVREGFVELVYSAEAAEDGWQVSYTAENTCDGSESVILVAALYQEGRMADVSMCTLSIESMQIVEDTVFFPCTPAATDAIRLFALLNDGSCTPLTI